MPDIKVLIVEDMEPIRKRYVKIINETENFTVVGDVGTGEEAVALYEKTTPDVILMDIEMESADAGLRASQAIFQKNPSVKIIILTVYEEDELIFAAFQLGVCDYILKNAKPEDVIHSIRCAYENNSPLRPELATKILSEFKRVRSCENSFLYAVNIVSSLTSTELEILHLLISHKSRSEICALRHVEMSTVKSQIHGILKKFHMKSVEEIVKLIDQMNLYDLIYNKVNRKIE